MVPKDLNITDTLGRELPLLKVVSESLKYITETMIRDIKDRIAIPLSNVEEILFVLTVPAIWTDSAKNFMRDAAEMVCSRITFDKFFFSVSVLFYTIKLI